MGPTNVTCCHPRVLLLATRKIDGQMRADNFLFFFFNLFILSPVGRIDDRGNVFYTVINNNLSSMNRGSNDMGKSINLKRVG